MTDKVVAVLSGGGAKAAAHVGAVKALEDRGLAPHHIVGTSMGAVIGACFASGLAYEDVLKRISAISRSDVASLSPGLVLGAFARSLLRGAAFRETIEAVVPARSFAELHCDLTVTGVDAITGTLALFGTGGRRHVPLIDALYASCALPVYYPPAIIGDREYVDGGLRAVLALDAALEFDPSLVVGVYVGPSLHNPPIAGGPGSASLIAAHRRALRIMMAVQANETMDRWTREPPVDFVLVRPRVAGGGTFDVDRIAEFVGEGYRATMRALAGRQAAG